MPPITKVTGAATYTAAYNPIYKIRFVRILKNGNEDLLQEVSIEEGNMP